MEVPMTLLERVEAHLSHNGIAPTRFGRSAANDPRLVLDMRRGRHPRARTVRRIAIVIGDAR
jgi:hypothetical protein